MTCPSSSDIQQSVERKHFSWKLASTIFWILIGGGIYSIAVVLPGSLLPLRLESGGVESDSIKMLILSTIGGILNMTVCPSIGVISDWHRSRFGRRIPFIFTSMPPIVIALVMMAYIPECSAWLQRIFSPFTTIAPGTATALAAGISMLLFQFFFMWIGTVIWYLLGDVVSAQHYGRVTAAFQLGMTSVSVIYNRWLFPLAREHMREIFIGGALIYLVGITLFCIFVKENKPDDGRTRPERVPFFKRMSKTLKECFCHRIYLFKYLIAIFFAVAACSANFSYFFYQSVFGVDPNVNTLELIGKLTSWTGIFTSIGITLISILAADFINRWHPIRTGVYLWVFSLCSLPAAFRWLYGTLSPLCMFYMTLGIALLQLPLNGISAVNGIPLELAIFPKSHFGSFCSMQAMFRSLIVTACSLLCGAFFDLMKPLFQVAGTHYRLQPVWPVPWQLLAITCALLMFHQWKKLGGEKGYNSPASWEASGFEQKEQLGGAPNTPLQRKFLIFTGDLLYLLVTATIIFCVWHCKIPFISATLIVPMLIMALAAALWYRVRSKLKNAGEICCVLLTIILLCHGITQVIRLASALWSSGSFLQVSLILPAVSMLLIPLAIAFLLHIESTPSKNSN